MQLVPNLKTAIDEKGARVLRVITKPVKLLEKTSLGLKGYTKAFIETLSALARKDENIVAISPAMLSGSGLDVFKVEFPERCFDVGIAEQHAVTFSAGMATQGLVPFCNIYSTFMQRAFDQVVHDVAPARAPRGVAEPLAVLGALDDAGRVGDAAEGAGPLGEGPLLEFFPELVKGRHLPTLVGVLVLRKCVLRK